MYNGILTFLLIISFEAKGGNFFRGIVMKKKIDKIEIVKKINLKKIE